MGGSKNYRTASNKRGQAIDTSLRWARKEGIDHNLSERPRERRTKDLTKRCCCRYCYCYIRKGSTRPVVMLIQLIVVKLARRYQPLATLHQ